MVWFERVYPTLKSSHPNLVWMEHVQEPGDIVYVPSGCVHVVLTLEPAIALSVNFVDRFNWERVLKATAASQPELAAALQHYATRRPFSK